MNDASARLDPVRSSFGPGRFFSGFDSCGEMPTLFEHPDQVKRVEVHQLRQLFQRQMFVELIFELLLDLLHGVLLSRTDWFDGRSAALEKFCHQIQKDSFPLKAGWGFFNELMLMQKMRAKSGPGSELFEKDEYDPLKAPLKHYAIDPFGVDIEHSIHPALIVAWQAVVDLPRVMVTTLPATPM